MSDPWSDFIQDLKAEGLRSPSDSRIGYLSMAIRGFTQALVRIECVDAYSVDRSLASFVFLYRASSGEKTGEYALSPLEAVKKLARRIQGDQESMLVQLREALEGDEILSYDKYMAPPTGVVFTDTIPVDPQSGNP